MNEKQEPNKEYCECCGVLVGEEHLVRAVISPGNVSWACSTCAYKHDPTFEKE